MRQETPIPDLLPSRSMIQTATYLQPFVLTRLALDSSCDGLRSLARSIRATPFSRKLVTQRVRGSEFRLQVAALQQNRSDPFHLLKRSIDVALFKLDSAAAIDDNMCVQSEVPRIECAVF